MARRLSDQQRILLEDVLDQIEDRWIKTIDDYHFPVVTLSEKTAPDALCTIFETLNRTGVKLSAFELLTARFWPESINLRSLWDQTRTAHPIIEDFDVDPYYVLMAIALASQSAKDVVELVAWLQGGPPPESVSGLRFDPRALRDVTPRQRSIYRGTICLILATGTGARDFHTQSAITSKLMAEQGIDDHHVFPAKFLERKGRDFASSA